MSWQLKCHCRTQRDNCAWVIIHSLTGNNNDINSDLCTSVSNLSALSFIQNSITVIWRNAVYLPAICAALKITSILQHPEHLWLWPQVDPTADWSSDPLQCTTDWAFPALICLFLMALRWILAVHQHVCLIPCACLLATATAAPISNLGFSPDCIFQDHASQFGSCCCWPFTSDVFDYRK